MNKISPALSERPYGKHSFKAAKLMRESILLGGLLTNVEGWINISKTDLEELEKNRYYSFTEVTLPIRKSKQGFHAT